MKKTSSDLLLEHATYCALRVEAIRVGLFLTGDELFVERGEVDIIAFGTEEVSVGTGEERGAPHTIPSCQSNSSR